MLAPTSSSAELVELLLPPEQLVAARDASARIGLPPSGWYHVPPLWEFCVTLAVQQEASRLRDRGVSAGTALSRACAQLGVNPETVRAKLRRWQTGHFRR